MATADTGSCPSCRRGNHRDCWEMDGMAMGCRCYLTNPDEHENPGSTDDERWDDQ